MVMTALLALAMMTGPAESAAATSIRLRCDGHADAVTQSMGLRLLSSGKLSTATSYGRKSDNARVLFELIDGAARIHLPSGLVTAVHSGDQDGWWPVGDLKVSDDAISGHVRINLINRPTFRIDRVNGDIDLHGLQPFHGDCESTAGQERKF